MAEGETNHEPFGKKTENKKGPSRIPLFPLLARKKGIRGRKVVTTGKLAQSRNERGELNWKLG